MGKIKLVLPEDVEPKPEKVVAMKFRRRFNEPKGVAYLTAKVKDGGMDRYLVCVDPDKGEVEIRVQQFLELGFTVKVLHPSRLFSSTCEEVSKTIYTPR